MAGSWLNVGLALEEAVGQLPHDEPETEQQSVRPRMRLQRYGPMARPSWPLRQERRREDNLRNMTIAPRQVLLAPEMRRPRSVTPPSSGRANARRG
jgi:hypothetical protein